MRFGRYWLLGCIILLSACSALPPAKLQGEEPSPARGKIAAGTADGNNSTDSTAPSGSQFSLLAKIADAALTASSAAPPPDDLWQHLRDHFTLLPATTPPAVEQAMERYQPRRVGRLFDNARPYLAYVTQQVEKRGMPLEVVLLPMVESHYNPAAYSPRHAAGLWQFIPATGKRYGLKQSWWYDGRRDVAASTNAALDYLQDLHRKTGDWLTALAAYNCGEGRVLGAMKRNRKQGKATDFWALAKQLPRETRSYVPKLIALATLIRHADQYGVNLPSLSMQTDLQRVKLDGRIELGVAAKLAGLSRQAFKRLNPGYKRWATAPHGTHYLLLPAANAVRLKAKLPQLNIAERMPATGPAGVVREYRIQAGDSLWKVARKHDTSVKVLCELNGISKRTTLRVGRKLLLPAPATLASYRPAAKPVSTGRRHQIRQGDTLWHLARHYGTTVKALRKLNNLPGHAVTLKVGTTLRIPAAQKI